MEKPKNTVVSSNEKSYVTCPQCNKVLIQAFTIIEGIIKCDKCHRRYLINVDDGSLFIKLLNKPKNED